LIPGKKNILENIEKEKKGTKAVSGYTLKCISKLYHNGTKSE